MKSRVSPSRLNLMLLAACLPLGVQAQVPPVNAGSVLKDVAPPKAPEPSRPEAPPAPLIRQEPEAVLALPAGETLFVKDYRVEGADFLDPAEVAELLAPFKGKALSLEELQGVANRITVLCREKGYLVARAYLPRQDARDGTVLIKVIAGRYGAMKFKNDSLVGDAAVQAYFDRVVAATAEGERPVVTQDPLERAMLLVGGLPGAQLPVVSIAPGEAPGTSDFTVAVPAGARYNGYAVLDDYGSRFTGKQRLSAGVDLNSPFAFGDKLSLSGLTTAATGLQNARVAYGAPLGSSGLTGELAVSHTTYKLGDQYLDLDASGKADTVEATLAYPIRRSRLDNINVSLNFAGKRLRDDIVAQDVTIAKHAQVLTLALQRETYAAIGNYPVYLNVTGSLTWGRLSFDDPAEKAANQAGAATAGRYSKANLDFNALVDLGAPWSLGANLKLQQALGRNLDASEQLSVSGPAGIKAYPDGVTGDNGYLAGLELKYALPGVTVPWGALDHSVSLFADQGAARPKDGAYTTVGEVTVSDFGFAYAVTDKTWFGRVQLARTLGLQKETDAYNGKHKLLVQVGLRF